MDNTSIGMGDKLKRGEKEYRVVSVNDDYLVLCELGARKLILTIESLDAILDGLADEKVFMVDEPQYVVDTQKMSDSERQLFEKKKEAMGRIVNEYGPDFMSISDKKQKPLLKCVAANFYPHRRQVCGRINSDDMRYTDWNVLRTEAHFYRLKHICIHEILSKTVDNGQKRKERFQATNHSTLFPTNPCFALYWKGHCYGNYLHPLRQAE